MRSNAAVQPGDQVSSLPTATIWTAGIVRRNDVYTVLGSPARPGFTKDRSHARNQYPRTVASAKGRPAFIHHTTGARRLRADAAQLDRSDRRRNARPSDPNVSYPRARHDSSGSSSSANQTRTHSPSSRRWSASSSCRTTTTGRSDGCWRTERPSWNAPVPARTCGRSSAHGR